MKLFLIILTLCSACSAFAKVYQSGFSLNENPVSESSMWINGAAVGVDWKNCQATNGIICGTQTGSGGYDDSTALLTGTWSTNQSVQGVVYKATLDDSKFPEVEFRLLSTVTANVNNGYEVYWSLRTTSHYCRKIGRAHV